MYSTTFVAVSSTNAGSDRVITSPDGITWTDISGATNQTFAIPDVGGLGVTHGVMVESLYREIRALRIYEGASDVQRVVADATGDKPYVLAAHSMGALIGLYAVIVSAFWWG